ncbi:MAG TPA: circadian clock KaiB family protein [Candidatus Polarisedimenticolia bacterium]|nr:circadian clock KaiB family protein [Candidatus Polarisedimenticolia bacterium]
MKHARRDSTAAFERLLERGPSQERYVLRLYVTGMTPRSSEAVAAVKSICREHLEGRYELEVIDLYQQPHLAREAQIVAMPTLVKKLPRPLRRLIGDLQDEDRVLAGLNLEPKPHGAKS